MKPVRLSGHARDSTHYRSASQAEVIEAIRSAVWTLAEGGRLECRKEFAYQAVWNGRFYDTKQVRPVFVEEPGEIVVVTVYVYYY